MRAATYIGFMAWCFCLSAWAGEEAGWGNDVTNALQSAKASHKPILLQFTAPWCPYCRQMENKTFKDQAVKDSLNGFERVAVNIDQNAGLAAQHAVRGIPAFVVLDSEGEEVAKTSGFMDAAPFNQWLVESMTNLTVSTTLKAEFQSRSQEVEQALASTDAATRAKGLGMVLDCCERREKLYRTFGLEKLQTLTQAEPQLLLDGLNHPGLMGRIRVANLLRQRLGNEFNVDPWEQAAVREQGVAAWKARLAAKPEPGNPTE
jgi:thioredoxin-related protein